MSAVHNEQTKLLATAINNVAVAFIVIGAVTPMTAASFGVPTAPTPRQRFLRDHLALCGHGPTFPGETCAAEHEAVNSGEIFVTFIIPAIVVAGAYLAVLANERAVRRSERMPPGE